MDKSLKLITQILGIGGGVVTGGTVIISGIAINNQIDINTKESNKDWFNQSKDDTNSRYKFKVDSFKEESPWVKSYEIAKRDYDLSKSYKGENYSLNYMEQGWRAFRDFCFEGISDLKSQGNNPSDAIKSDSFEKWAETREYWFYCINMRQ